MTVESGVGGPDDGREKYEPSDDKDVLAADLNDLIGVFDKRHDALDEVFKHLAEHQDEIDDALDALGMRAEDVTVGFKAILAKLATMHTPGTNEFVASVSTFWVEADHRRIDTYKNLSPSVQIAKIGKEGLEEVIRTACEQNEDIDDLVHKLTEAFGISLVKDGDELLASWRADAYVASMNGTNKATSHEGEPGKDTRQFRPTVEKWGYQVLDVLKITLGVASGIVAGFAADRYLRRRK